MFRISSLPLIALLGAITQSTHAQTIDCACSGEFSVGDRVITLVDNPGFSGGLPAGTAGTVICGDANAVLGNPILVRWDNYTGSVTGQPSFCDCFVPAGDGTTGDQFVRCTEIVLAPVRNVSQGTTFATVQSALDAAVSGDVIEIDPVTIMEDGIVAPDGLNVTIRGAGNDQTIIDGMGNASLSDAILAFANSTDVVISDLTFRNGLTTTFRTGAALQVTNTSITCRNVDFIDNENASGQLGGAHVFGDGGAWHFSHCSFQEGTVGDGISVRNGPLSLEQCLLAREQALMLQAGNAPAALLNCTVVGALRPTGTSLTLTNSTVDGLIQLQFSGTLSASRSLFAGATGDNINGIPTFVDAMNGDYRLAAGSLGIDAADVDAYLAAGGGIADLNGAFRFADDAGTPNTGTGINNSLDIGAFEFQGTSPGSPGGCPGDADGNGRTETADITFVVSNLGCTSN